MASEMPFLCGHCGNWYTPITLEPDDTCQQLHAGGVGKAKDAHCHYADRASTESEQIAGTAYWKAFEAKEAIVALSEAKRPGGKATEQASALLSAAAQAATQLELAGRIADTFVFPGRDDRLWINKSSLAEIVAANRRPPSDLETIQRSIRVTRTTIAAAQTELAEAQALMAKIVPVAEELLAPVAPVTSRKPYKRKQASPEPVSVG